MKHYNYKSISKAGSRAGYIFKIGYWTSTVPPTFCTAVRISAKDKPLQPDPPPSKGMRTIKQIPLGDAISIRFKRLITAPAGMKILSIVPGN